MSESFSVASTPASIPTAPYTLPPYDPTTVPNAPPTGSYTVPSQAPAPFGVQLREAIRQGVDPWQAAAAGLRGADKAALASLATSADPLTRFFALYKATADRLGQPMPQSHRDAVASMPRLLAGMGQADRQAFLSAAASLGLNLGMSQETLAKLVPAVKVSGGEAGVIDGFRRSAGLGAIAQEMSPPVSAPPQPPTAQASVGGTPSGGDETSSAAAVGDATPTAGTLPDVVSLQRRQDEGESPLSLAAEFLVTQRGTTLEAIAGLPTPELRQGAFALAVMQDLGFQVVGGVGSDGRTRYAMVGQRPQANGQPGQVMADLGRVRSWTELNASLGVDDTTLRQALGGNFEKIRELYGALGSSPAQPSQTEPSRSPQS